MPHPAPAHKSFSDRTSLYQEITDKIIAELEQGRVPWVQPWAGVSVPLGLPRNASTGRPYSGINILILWCAVTERGFTGQKWLHLPPGARHRRLCRSKRNGRAHVTPVAVEPDACVY